MNVQQIGPAAFKKPRLATRTSCFAATAPGRLFGLDAGDWSMILLGLALSGLLLALV